MIKRSISNILLLLCIIIFMICGTGAVYIEKKQTEITVNSASIGLMVSEPVFSDIPEKISNGSEIFFSVSVENTGSVPIYVLENITYEISGGFDSTDVIFEKAVDEPGSGILDSYNMLGSKEAKDVTYRISFPGVMEIPEGSLCINGSIEYKASTTPDGSFGFVTEPEEVNISIMDLELYSDNWEEYAMVEDNIADNDEEIYESVDIATESTLYKIFDESISTASEIDDNTD